VKSELLIKRWVSRRLVNAVVTGAVFENADLTDTVWEDALVSGWVGGLHVSVLWYCGLSKRRGLSCSPFAETSSSICL
jgi:hypothetical protein